MAKNKKKLAEKIFHKKTENQKKSINPFEIHINKQKYEVLGQKSKHDHGLPGVSRAKAIKKRKHTLLPEYTTKHKSNQFIDRRIGEKNFTMTAEDKTMARFTAEKMRHHNKKSIYNLADDEVLTHRGQTLLDIQQFDDPRSDDDDDVDDQGRKTSGKLDDNFVEDAHFGGGVLTKTGKEGAKSHKDLIEQLIAESKKRKAEKQKTKEETLELTEKLDSEWKDLLPLVSKSKKDKNKEEVQQKQDNYDKIMRELIFEARGNPTDRLKSEDELAKEEKNRLEKLEEDRQKRMMGIFDKPERSKHRSADDLDDNFNYDSDPEEILAYDDKGELINKIQDENNEIDEGFEKEDENIEEEESDEEETDDDLSDLKESESDSDDEINSKETNNTIKTKREIVKIDLKGTKNKQQNIEEEEIDDDLLDLKQIKSESDSDNKINSKEICNTIKENTQTKRELINIDSKNTKNEQQNIEKIKNTSYENQLQTAKNLQTIKSMKEETQTNEEIIKIESKNTENIEDLGAEKNINELKTSENLLIPKEESPDKNLIMEKAKKELPYTYSVPESYESFQSLLSDKLPEYQDVIIERMIKCSHPSLAAENKDHLNRLFVYLLQHLNDSAPEKLEKSNIINCFRILNIVTPHIYNLAHLNSQFRDSFVELITEKQSDYKKNLKQFPELDVILFLKLVSCIFSTSDFRHQIVTPTFIFISQMLTYCKTKTRYDIMYGLFLVTLVLEYTALSKRYLPAVITYLTGLLHMAVPKTGVRVIKIHPPFKSNSTNLVLAESYKNNKLNLQMTADDFVSTEFDEEFKIKILSATLKLCHEFQENWKDLPSNINIFSEFYALLEKIPKENYPKVVQNQIEEMINYNITTKSNKKLNYITIQQKKPKALRLYEPNIQQVFEFKKAKPMSKEKAEREKLQYKYKKEMKGAVREIRRDKSFLGRIKIKQQVQSDYERREKVKRIYSEASMQQSELNALDRKKKKK